MHGARAHRVVGITTVALAIVHTIAVIATRHGIKPYSTLGWLPERLLDGFGVLLAGALMIISTKALSRGVRAPALASAALLATLCIIQYLRSFAPMPLLFTFVALADGLVIAASWTARVPFLLATASALTFVAAAARSRGPEPAPPAPRAHDVMTPGADYERFRVDTYLSSGVAPKRYFGFFDERGDTAAAEAELRDTTIRAVAIANAFASDAGLPVRITEKEVAVTFLAEGGALLFTEAQDKLDAVHPVRDEGLDNFRLGFTRFPKLVETLDTELGTGLARLTATIGGRRVLLRPMTLREAILGTAVMYLYEKELTHDARVKASLPALAGLPLDAQFVTTSLVYNCGLLFSDDRVAAILGLSTGPYLVQVNADNAGKRPALPVLPEADARARLAAGEPIPQQLTSWSAVYHVLQRYGAWAALEKFTTVFDATGSFTQR